MMIQYEEKKEFQNDFKDLLKKFPSLKEDFEINKQYRIELFHNILIITALRKLKDRTMMVFKIF